MIGFSCDCGEYWTISLTKLKESISIAKEKYEWCDKIENSKGRQELAYSLTNRDLSGFVGTIDSEIKEGMGGPKLGLSIFKMVGMIAWSGNVYANTLIGNKKVTSVG